MCIRAIREAVKVCVYVCIRVSVRPGNETKRGASVRVHGMGTKATEEDKNITGGLR